VGKPPGPRARAHPGRTGPDLVRPRLQLGYLSPQKILKLSRELLLDDTSISTSRVLTFGLRVYVNYQGQDGVNGQRVNGQRVNR